MELFCYACHDSLISYMTLCDNCLYSFLARARNNKNTYPLFIALKASLGEFMVPDNDEKLRFAAIHASNVLLKQMVNILR